MHQEGAWLPDQVVDFMMIALGRAVLYLCPDAKSIPRKTGDAFWATGDIADDRPPLSGGIDFAEDFKRFEGRDMSDRMKVLLAGHMWSLARNGWRRN